MSFRIDCSFQTPQDPSQRLLEQFLAGRIWYDSGAETITYADTDTGVGFELAITVNDDEEIEGVRFELEEGRPEVYGREVGEELAALADEFDLDFQAEADPVEGPNEAVELWKQANRRALERRSEQDGSEIYAMASDDLQKAWRWNRHRQTYHRQLAGSVFVPRVLFFQRGGELQRGVIWPDAIPLALPKVDMLLVSLAGESGGEDGQPDSYIVDYDVFLQTVDRQAEQRDDPVEHRLLRWEEAPSDLVGEIVEKSEVADRESLEGLPAERIFERELVD